MLDGIGSNFIGASTGGQAAEAKDLFEGSADTYLQLFLATLKNQDPSEPFAIKDMTQQLAQLNTSRQQIAMNENLEKIIEFNEQSQVQSYLNLIGREVAYESEDIFFDGQRNVSISFDNTDNFKEVEITVKDSEGNTVLSQEMAESELDLKTNTIYWDGTNAQGEANIGYYTVEVSGKNQAGQKVDVSTMVTGTVGAIDFTDGEPILSVGFDKSYKIDVPFGEIATVGI